MLKCFVRNVTDCETNIHTGGFSNEYSYHCSSGHPRYSDRSISRTLLLRMPLKDSGLPQMVIDQTPKLMRRSKLPIVKAKVGPKISILIADEKVFDLIPVKKEIKAEVSGLYIVGVKGIRGSLETPQKKKKGFLARFRK